jgi:hypothetical protein
MTSFLLLQIAQRIGQTPTRIRDLVLELMPFNKLPNNFLMLVGRGILKVKCTTCHTSLVNLYRIKRCPTGSSNHRKHISYTPPISFLLSYLLTPLSYEGTT